MRTEVFPSIEKICFGLNPAFVHVRDQHEGGCIKLLRLPPLLAWGTCSTTEFTAFLIHPQVEMPKQSRPTRQSRYRPVCYLRHRQEIFPSQGPVSLESTRQPKYLHPSQVQVLKQVKKMLRTMTKVVVISGAGISTNAKSESIFQGHTHQNFNLVCHSP